MSHTTQVTIKGHLQIDDQRQIFALPFDVPTDIGRMEVLLEFNDRIGSEPWETEGNALDIGIFDSRENDDSSKGFRGWSGSSRMEFY